MLGYGELAEGRRRHRDRPAEVPALKPESEFTIVGKPMGRTDAYDIVTGRKKFAMDLDIEGALPTMVCRAPTINGKPKKLNNEAEILKMPGVTDVALTGRVTGDVRPVRDAATFGHVAVGTRSTRWT